MATLSTGLNTLEFALGTLFMRIAMPSGSAYIMDKWADRTQMLVGKQLGTRWRVGLGARVVTAVVVAASTAVLTLQHAPPVLVLCGIVSLVHPQADLMAVCTCLTPLFAVTQFDRTWWCNVFIRLGRWLDAALSHAKLPPGEGAMGASFRFKILTPNRCVGHTESRGVCSGWVARRDPCEPVLQRCGLAVQSAMIVLKSWPTRQGRPRVDVIG